MLLLLALLRLFFFKDIKDAEYLAPPGIFFVFPRLCWAGYGPV